MNTKQSVAQLAVPHRKRLSSTMVVALLLCVVAGAVMINAADFPATAIETDPGASAFPTFYACALIVLAVLLVIRDLLQAKPASCANAQEKPAFRKTATGIAATAFYIVAMSYCGYLITTPVFLIVIMTLMGYFMQKGGYPASPVVLALIMGPMAESNFRRALSLSGGSLDFLYTRPITLALLTLAAFTLLTPIIRKIMRLRRQ